MLSYRPKYPVAWNIVAINFVELRMGYIFVVKSWIITIDATSRSNLENLLPLFIVGFAFPTLIIGLSSASVNGNCMH